MVNRVVRAADDPVVLFVDDDVDMLKGYQSLFRREKVVALIARSGLHALQVLRDETVDVVVSDYWMPGMNGIQLLDEVQRLYPKTRRLLCTGDLDAEIVFDAKHHHQVLRKGMDSDLIRQVILRESRK